MNASVTGADPEKVSDVSRTVKSIFRPVKSILCQLKT